MILTTTTQFNTMVAGQDQVLAWRITMTLPAGSYTDMSLAVESMELDASTTSDMPAQTRLQVGYPAMSARFVLGGLVDTTDETKTVAWLFGRYSTTSPLYRRDCLAAPVTIDLGLYPDNASGTPEYVRKFTGVIDDYTANSDGSVSFTCLELMRSLLRAAPDLSTATVYADMQMGVEATAEYALDAILRSSTQGAVSSWPAPRSQCVFAAGLRSSLQPEVGSFDPTFSTNPAAVGNYGFAPGAFGTALLLGDNEQLGWACGSNSPTTQYTTAYVHIEAWVTDVIANNFNIRADIGAGSVALWYTSAGNFRAELSNHFIDLPATFTAGAHYIAADFTIVSGLSTSTWSATGYIDATPFAFGAGAAATTIVTGHITNVSVFGNGTTTVEGIQVTAESAPASNSGFTPTAVLDPSLNRLQAIPPVTGDAYQLLQQICDAELGVGGGDESGIFRFYNRDTIRGVASSRSLTSAASLTAIGGVETTAAAVVNRAKVEYTDWTYAAAASTVFELDTPTVVRAHSSITLTPTTANVITDVDTSLSILPDGTTDTTTSRYRTSIDKAGTAPPPGAGFTTYSIVQTGTNQLSVTINNTNGFDVWFVSPANFLDLAVGTPLLRVAAREVTSSTLTAEYQYPGVNADGTGGAKTTRFGEVANQISGNPWIQGVDSALALAEAIVVDMAVARPNLTNVGIVPDPRLQLVDVARIQDPDVTLVDEYGRIFGWTITWVAGGPGGEDQYAMTIEARTLAAPGGWIMGVAGRSEVGTTTYVYPSV